MSGELYLGVLCVFRNSVSQIIVHLQYGIRTLGAFYPCVCVFKTIFLFPLGENPFEIEEKAIDVDEKEAEDKNPGDMDEDRQDSEQVEKDPSEDKNEKNEEDKNEEGTENSDENTGEEKDSAVEEQNAEEKEQDISTTGQGLCPQVSHIFINRSADGGGRVPVLKFQ